MINYNCTWYIGITKDYFIKQAYYQVDVGVNCSFLRSRLLRCLRQWTSALRSLSCRWNSVQQPCDSSTSGQTFSLKRAPLQTWLHLRASHPQFISSQSWHHQRNRGVWTARRSHTSERRSSERIASCSGDHTGYVWERKQSCECFRILIRYNTRVWWCVQLSWRMWRVFFSPLDQT